MIPYARCPQCNDLLIECEKTNPNAFIQQKCNNLNCIKFSQFISDNRDEIIWIDFETTKFAIEMTINATSPHNIYIFQKNVDRYSIQSNQINWTAPAFMSDQLDIQFPLDLAKLDDKLSLYITFS